ncbi:MAG: methylmalonyl-CoA mutase [Flavobacteriaceae bacterium]|nr:methylmalonyl-CoA mutase [Flavobacteriaceae bacterium]
MKKNNNLFSEFDPVSAKAWKQKIQVDLKGADYNDTLIWNSLEGIDVRPFYHRDDFETPPHPIDGIPNSWQICQSIFVDDASIANRMALDALDRGADAILFSAEGIFDHQTLFKNFDFEKCSIYFRFHFLSVDFLQSLRSFLSEKNADISFQIDILGHLSQTGNWYKSLQKDHEILDKINTELLSAPALYIDSTNVQNAGANMVQQLAYMLAHANEYLNHYHQKEISLKNASCTFNVAVGSNYFFEIAKLRALRQLYATLAHEYSADPICKIIATPTRRDKTLYDFNVNMLRTTTQSMSAVLGGADVVCSMPYDHIFHKSNEFGERIARNQLLILKAESHLDVVSNAAEGSYYIETLTEQLARKALVLFKEIEENGGYLQQLKAGVIQKKIKESAQKEQILFDEGKLVLLGTNLYQNSVDRMKESLELYPFLKTNIRKTEIQPIIAKRLAETMEKERLDHE